MTLWQRGAARLTVIAVSLAAYLAMIAAGAMR